MPTMLNQPKARDTATARWFAVLAATALSMAICASRAEAATNVKYTYDALGRVTSIAYDNGTTVYYLYDAAGNRITQVIGPKNSGNVWGSFTWGSPSKW